MDTASIIREKDRLQAGLSVLTTKANADFTPECPFSLLTLEGEGLVLSTLKLPERSSGSEAIVRIVNYSTGVSAGKLICGKALRCVQKTNLLKQPDDNEPLVPIECAHCVPIQLEPWKIVTLKLSFQS